jgi:methylated-DNA-[protein]-cysteine S-methyltransferase
MTYALCTYDSPLGELRLIAGDDGLAAILWPIDTDRVSLVEQAVPSHHRVLDRAIEELDAYFVDPAHRFEIDLDLHGTDFQRQTWLALADIEAGSTVTYGTLAQSLGRPSGARAVGAAVGKNPVSIILPCHRVVGADGSMTGFAGGIDAKRQLLAHEGLVAQPAAQ